MWKKCKFYIKGLDCPNCAREIAMQLNKKKEYKNVVINFSKLMISFETNYKEQVFEHLEQDVAVIDSGVTFYEEQKEDSLSKDYFCIVLGILFFGFHILFQNFSFFSSLLILCSYLCLGYKTLWKAILLLKKGVLNENFLIVISALGAFFIEKPKEGFMVLFLYELGKVLEKKATGNVRKNVAKLMEIKTDVAHKKVEDGYITVSPEEIQIHDTLIILKGERVPLDGIMMSEQCELDTSSLTGESRLSVLKKQDEILSGCINVGDKFELKVTKLYQDSTVKRILDLMENASDKKAKTENFVNRAAKYYTPLMILISLMIFLITPYVFSISYEESFYRALMILVVSCPCAIAISVPLCYFAGLGRFSKSGILVKGSNYIDAIYQMKYLVFDKTGTLTTGNFGITKVVSCDSHYQEDDIIRYLVYGETFSNHPLAKSIVSKYSISSIPEITKLKEFEGKGISYEWEGHKVKLGNTNFVKTDIRVSQTVIFVSLDDQVIGYVLFGDDIKKEAKECIQALREDGIQSIMFTGDKKEAACVTAKEISLDSYQAELLPDDKFQSFEKLKKENPSSCIAFVGDGINDAPVLRLSDCGIAMGSGAASAIEASDVVIMSSSLNKILESRKIASKTILILKENLLFAFLAKLLIMGFSFFGIGSMWLAVLGDVGVTLLTILNSLRILR